MSLNDDNNPYQNDGAVKVPHKTMFATVCKCVCVRVMLLNDGSGWSISTLVVIGSICNNMHKKETLDIKS
eukprot:1677941-Amphidinium_carterae.1